MLDPESRRAIVARVEAALDRLEAAEEFPEGIVPALLEDDAALPDLYTLLGQMTALTREVQLQGRAANRIFIDRAPARPSHSGSTQMIALPDECWRLASRTIARALGLVSRLRDVIADVRESRRKLEADLFHDRYRLVSKNDDDLPIVR